MKKGVWPMTKFNGQNDRGFAPCSDHCIEEKIVEQWMMRNGAFLWRSLLFEDFCLFGLLYQFQKRMLLSNITFLASSPKWLLIYRLKTTFICNCVLCTDSFKRIKGISNPTVDCWVLQKNCMVFWRLPFVFSFITDSLEYFMNLMKSIKASITCSLKIAHSRINEKSTDQHCQ